MSPAPTRRRSADINRLEPADRPVHDWYRFVLSFPPHLVRDYLARFAVAPHQLVLDPFCGTGTTLVECQKLGIPSVGLEGNPMAHFASTVKLDWSPDPRTLLRHTAQLADAASAALLSHGLTDEPELASPFDDEPSDLGAHDFPQGLGSEQCSLLLKNSISQRPLYKAQALLGVITQRSRFPGRAHARLALARAVVNHASNLHFGPEVGLGKIRPDAAVIAPWVRQMEQISQDLQFLRGHAAVPTRVIHADAREVGKRLEPGSVHAVITSPPYPNEKDYTRTTRLESVLLGFIKNKDELRRMKEGLVRSNTRGAFVADRDDAHVEQFASIQTLARQIEDRRIELGKTSGFERMYARVTRLYFGGMYRHLADLRRVLVPGAQLAYVVGDQASYLQVMIRTGQLLAEIAQSLGYRVRGIDLFRTRIATATGEQLREEVVVLEWPGK